MQNNDENVKFLLCNLRKDLPTLEQQPIGKKKSILHLMYCSYTTQ